jgi:hypothetical protein
MKRILIILLTLITAVIHIYEFTLFPKDLLFILFLLNGLGFLGLLGLMYLPLRLPQSLHRLVRPIFIGYILLTIVLYFIVSVQQNYWSVPLGPIAKVDEAILAGLLWSEGAIKKAQTA